MGINKYGGICDVDTVDAKEYRLWYGMLRRCYDRDQQARSKGVAYADCKVCDKWMLYSNFERDVRQLAGYQQWYESDDMQLDKDILSGDDKEYNPQNCCFVPRQVNMAYMNKTHPNITKQANEANKVAYMLRKGDEVLVFESEKDACEYLGVVKCSVSSCYHKGYKCKGYVIARMDGGEDAGKKKTD